MDSSTNPRREPSAAAGYSGTPLHKKLGLKAGQRALFESAPESFFESLDAPPALDVVPESDRGPLEFILVFTANNAQLTSQFRPLAARLSPAGMLWIAWPKRSSGMKSDLSENAIRDFGLESGMVDVKVCAIDETWSGLKFVFRLKDRPGR